MMKTDVPVVARRYAAYKFAVVVGAEAHEMTTAGKRGDARKRNGTRRRFVGGKWLLPPEKQDKSPFNPLLSPARKPPRE